MTSVDTLVSEKFTVHSIAVRGSDEILSGNIYSMKCKVPLRITLQKSVMMPQCDLLSKNVTDGAGNVHWGVKNVMKVSKNKTERKILK